MRKDKNKVLMYIGNLYNFDQFYSLIIRDLSIKNKQIYLLIEKNDFNEVFISKIDEIKRKSLINDYFFLEITGSNKLKNFKNLYFLKNKLQDINLFSAGNFFLPEIVMLEQFIINQGGKSILLMDSMMNESVWIESKNIQIKNKNILKKVKNSKSLYEIFVLLFNKIRLGLMKFKKRIYIFLVNSVSSKILSYHYGLKTVNKTGYEKYGISYGGKHLILAHDEMEKIAIKKVQPELNVCVAQQPYYLFSNEKTGKNLLVLVPGPFSKFQLETASKNFIEIIEKTLIVYKPKKVILRFHPRQDKQLEKLFVEKINKFHPNHLVQDNLNESLLDAIPKCFCVVGGASQALRVARLSNSKVIVIGVLNALYASSLWDENILLSGLEGVHWAKTHNDLNFKNIKNSTNFFSSKIYKTYTEVLLQNLK